MIRKAEIKDKNSIIELWEEMMNFHIQKNDIYRLKPDSKKLYSNFLEESFSNDSGIILVYEFENRILGYIMAEEFIHPPVYKEDLIGMILEISITETHRNEGIGNRLLLEVEKWFKKRGIDRLECMVSDFNNVSKNFWTKNGYEPYNSICVKKI